MSGIERLQKKGFLSIAVRHGGVVYLSGLTADDLTAGIEGQTRETLAKIDAALDAAGSDRSRLLSAQIWLKDIAADRGAMNAVWSAWLPAGEPPARACVQAQMARPECLVEIMVTAVAG